MQQASELDRKAVFTMAHHAVLDSSERDQRADRRLPRRAMSAPE